MEEQLFVGILGFYVGDALGVPVEFRSREERKKDPIEEIKNINFYLSRMGFSKTFLVSCGRHFSPEGVVFCPNGNPFTHSPLTLIRLGRYLGWPVSQATYGRGVVFTLGGRMSAGLNEDELITLRAICWLSNRLWQQYFDEAKTVYEEVLALAQLPGGRHYLWDISLALDKALRATKHGRMQTRRRLLTLLRALKKVLAEETKQSVAEQASKSPTLPHNPPKEVEVWVFFKDGGPPKKRPLLY